MDVIAITRQLGEALQQEEAYIQYQLAKDLNDKDEGLQADIGEFNLLRMSLSNELAKDETEKSQSKIDELNSQMQALYGKIMSNENMARFNQVKEELDKLVNRINSILVLCINGEDPQTCEPSECTGSCSSCGGCH